MKDREQEITQLLKVAEMSGQPDPVRMESVRERLLQSPAAASRPRRNRRAAGLAVLLLAGAATAGIAGTQAGQRLLRRIVTPVRQSQVVVLSPETAAPAPAAAQPPGKANPEASQPAGGPTESGTVAMAMFVTGVGGDVPPIPPEQQAAMQAEMAEIELLHRSGGGRLIGIDEGTALDRENTTPDVNHPHTTFTVEYTLSNGKTVPVGTFLTPQQRERMQVDEILALRDSGAGQLISENPGPLGMGRYLIRFTLVDGATVDLETLFPPGTAAQRAQIFAETRALKAARQFTVAHADAGPGGMIMGLLRYRLADGREVGLAESVPADVLSPDGKQVITFEHAPETAAAGPP